MDRTHGLTEWQNYVAFYGGSAVGWSVAGTAMILGKAPLTFHAGSRFLKLALHPADHSFRWLGKMPHFQATVWRDGVRGSGRSWRGPVPDWMYRWLRER